MNYFKAFSLITVLFISFLITSCEDDNITEQKEHFVPEGTAIFDATGALTLSIFHGETSDTLIINKGELSDHFGVKFYDENQTLITPPNNDEIKMNYRIIDNSIVEFWQHEGEEGEFEFHLRGLKQGSTQIELMIDHDGHTDYRSGEIPVVVK